MFKDLKQKLSESLSKSPVRNVLQSVPNTPESNACSSSTESCLNTSDASPNVSILPQETTLSRGDNAGMEFKYNDIEEELSNICTPDDVDVSSLSIEELIGSYQRIQQQNHIYRTKCSELLAVCKKLDEESANLKVQYADYDIKSDAAKCAKHSELESRDEELAQYKEAISSAHVEIQKLKDQLKHFHNSESLTESQMAAATGADKDQLVSSEVQHPAVAMTDDTINSVSETVEANKKVAELQDEIQQLRQKSNHDQQQLLSTMNQVDQLQRRIQELVSRENQLNTELANKRSAELNQSQLQNEQILTLRSEIDALHSRELALRHQLDESRNHCEQQMTDLNSQNVMAISNLSEMLESNQKQFMALLGELNEAQMKVEDSSVKLDQRSAQLEEALGHLTETEQRLSQALVNESGLRKQLSELESRRGLLEEKVRAYEQTLAVGSEGITEVMHRITELEDVVIEKDRIIFERESSLRSLEERLDQEISEYEQQMESLSAQNQQLQHDIEDLSKTWQRKFADQEQLIAQKETELKAQQSREFVDRTLFEEKLPEVDIRSELLEILSITDIEQQLIKLNAISENRLAALQRKYMIEVFKLNKQLQYEKDNMKMFKEHVQKQFEDQQTKMRWTIRQLQEGFDQSIVDREELFKTKMQNLERQKDREKADAIRELNIQLEKLNAVHQKALAANSSEMSVLQVKSEEMRQEINLMKNAEDNSDVTGLKDIEQTASCIHSTTADHGKECERLIQVENGKRVQVMKNSTLTLGEITQQHPDFDAQLPRILSHTGSEVLEYTSDFISEAPLGINDQMLSDELQPDTVESSLLYAQPQEKSSELEERRHEVQRLEAEVERLLVEAASKDVVIQEQQREIERLNDNGKARRAEVCNSECMQQRMNSESDKDITLPDEASKTQIDLLSEQIQNETTEDKSMQSFKESHEMDMATMKQTYEKKMADLVNEHDELVKEYQERISVMELSDVELNSQLLTLTERLNSVTEYTMNSERLIAELRQQVDRYQTEKAELQQQIAAVTDKDVKYGEVDLLKEQLSKDVVVTADTNLLLPMTSTSVFDGDNDSPDLRETVNRLSQENKVLSGKLQQLSSEEEKQSGIHKQTLERLHLEHKAAMQELESEHNLKVIQLIKDLKEQMASQEKELMEPLTRDIESSRKTELRLLTEHKEQMAELSKQLTEKDKLIEEYETGVQIAESSEKRYRMQIDELNGVISEMQQRIDAMLPNSDATNNNPLTEVKDSCTECHGLPVEQDDVKLTSDMSCLQAENTQLQAEIKHLSEHVAKLTSRDQELHKESVHSSCCRHSSMNRNNVVLLPEPTEIEYLRNILYKYMLGTETKTLAKVICTVVKFTEEQTKKVLEREASKKEVWLLKDRH